MATPFQAALASRSWRGVEALTRLRAARNLAGSSGPLLDLEPYLRRCLSVRPNYGSHKGSTALRMGIASACGVEPDDILVTPGATLALALIAMATLEPGSQALLATPCYSPARHSLLHTGADVIEYRLRFEEGYRLDPKRFHSAISAKTKLVSLASPHNPSGTILSPDVLRQTSERLCANGAVLLVDESFREAVYSPEQLTVSSAALSKNVVAVGSLSKAYGVPGLRIGWIATQDRKRLQILTRLKAEFVHSCSVLDEALAAEILNDRAALLDRHGVALVRAMKLVAEWADANSALIEWIRPAAGAIACIRLRADRFGTVALSEVQARLAATDIALAPGSAFGEEDRVFRIGLASRSLEPALRDLACILANCASNECRPQ